MADCSLRLLNGGLLLVACLLAAGCKKQTETAATAPKLADGPQEPTVSATDEIKDGAEPWEAESEGLPQPLAGGWMDTSTESAMDGAIFRKQLSIQSGNLQAFTIIASCTQRSKGVSLSVTSTGPDGVATPASTYQVAGTTPLVSIPIGRAKPAGFPSPVGLNSVAFVDSNIGNLLYIGGMGRSLNSLYQQATGIEVNSSSIGSIFAFLPLVLEVTTGNGKFEVVIPQSQEIASILVACGHQPVHLADIEAAGRDAKHKAQEAEAEFERRKREVEARSIHDDENQTEEQLK